MADDQLQSLLDRISEEGLKKSAKDCEERLAKARSDAEAIVTEAREQAERTVAEAEREASLLLEKGRESLRQAARDVLLSLRAQLEERFQAVARFCVRDSLEPGAVTDVIAALISAYVSHEGDVERLDVLLSEDQITQVEAALASRLADDLKSKCHLEPVAELSGGFRVVFDGTDVVYDFSDEALAQALSSFLSPKLAELLRPSAD